MNPLDLSHDPLDEPRSEPVEPRFEGAGLQPRRYVPGKTRALAPEGSDADAAQIFSHEFDGQLTQALRPVDPPPGFAAKIMELAASPAASQAPRKPKLLVLRPRWQTPALRLWATGALAAALVACFFTGEQLHRRHQQELADQQFLTAVRITDHALAVSTAQTRAQLLRAGINLSN
jgi:hypothetical protein